MLNKELITEILNLMAYNGVSTPKVAVGIYGSLYPEGYDKNDPMKNYNDWVSFITDPKLFELRKFEADVEEL